MAGTNAIRSCKESLNAGPCLQNLNHLLDAKASIFPSQHEFLNRGHDRLFHGSRLRAGVRDETSGGSGVAARSIKQLRQMYRNWTCRSVIRITT